MAELIAAAVADPSLAENKCVEVVAETTAPLVSYEELLAQSAVEITQEERIAREEAAQQAAADVADAEAKVRGVLCLGCCWSVTALLPLKADTPVRMRAANVCRPWRRLAV